MRAVAQGVTRRVAQEVLGVSRQRIHQLVVEGQLAEVRIYGVRMISGNSLRALAAERRRRDREAR